MAYECERHSPQVGLWIADIHLISRAASEDPDLAPYKPMIKAAEDRLAAVSALKLVKALVEHSRLTRERLKI